MEGFAEGDLVADRYRLGPAVGHGAMGEVHLAEDLRLARPVAVKSLRAELARYPDVRQRFGQEARAAARISHPNVVRIYDTGEQGRIPYLVMECLPGTSLVDELAWGPLEPRRARRVGLDVLGALDAAHRLGVVHRDVKPGNILLTAAIDGPVKVSDFGIAKSTDEHSITESGALVGTPAYLAPERVAGEPAVPASDLYSLGVVLYEGLAGRRPYEAESSLALALAIHMGESPDLLELRPDLDPALVAIVDKALARHPSERWASAAEMADALHAWRPRASSRPVAGADGAGGSAVAAAALAAGPAAAAGAGAGAATIGVAGSAAGAGDPAAAPLAAAPTVTLAPGDLPAAAVGPVATAPAAGASDGAAGFHLDDGSAAAAQRRRRRIGVLCAAAAGLALVGVLGLTALKTPGRAEPEPPPTSAAPVAEAPAVSSPATTVLESPPSSAAVTTRRPVRRARAPVTTAAPAAPVTRAPTTTAAPLRVTTTTRRTTTTVRATTTTTVVVPTPGA